MGIVIKSKGIAAPSGAEKLYRDALVSDGTLLLQDFSNFGNLIDFDITNWATDLAKEASEELNIYNSTKLKWNPENVVKPELSAGRGYQMTSLGRRNVNPLADFGLNYGIDLGKYLADNQPNFSLTFWFHRVPSIPLGGRVMLYPTNEAAPSEHLMSINVLDGGAVNPSIAGVPGGSVLSTGSINQYTLEYRGAGQKLRRFMNGAFHSETASNAGVLKAPISGLILGNNETNANDIGCNIYRVIIEDLSLSGRSADSLVKKDWEYCQGIGEFAGRPTKRPFIDLV